MKRQAVDLETRGGPTLVQPTAAGLERARAALEKGGLVAFPTDTVYGLGCVPTDGAALRAFYAAKGRPADQPSVLLAHSLEALRGWVDLDERALKLAARFWPGPLTLIMPLDAGGGTLPQPSRASLARIAKDGAIAVRIPDHPVALRLLAAWGAPLCTSSANRAGEPPPTTGAAAVGALAGLPVLVLDGESRLGKASSILDLTRAEPVVLREGTIPATRLLR